MSVENAHPCSASRRASVRGEMSSSAATSSSERYASPFARRRRTRASNVPSSRHLAEQLLALFAGQPEPRRVGSGERQVQIGGVEDELGRLLVEARRRSEVGEPVEVRRLGDREVDGPHELASREGVANLTESDEEADERDVPHVAEVAVLLDDQRREAALYPEPQAEGRRDHAGVPDRELQRLAQ